MFNFAQTLPATLARDWKGIALAVAIASGTAVYTDWRRWFANNRSLAPELRQPWDWTISLYSAIEAGGAVLLASAGASSMLG